MPCADNLLLSDIINQCILHQNGAVLLFFESNFHFVPTEESLAPSDAIPVEPRISEGGGLDVSSMSVRDRLAMFERR